MCVCEMEKEWRTRGQRVSKPTQSFFFTCSLKHTPDHVNALAHDPVRVEYKIFSPTTASSRGDDRSQRDKLKEGTNTGHPPTNM